MAAKYINPYTDFGFKKIFGEEVSKPQLIDFLNALLPEKSKILDLSFKNPENLAQTDNDRKVIFDIFCENEKGEKFIVELQKAKQNYFKERTVYYSTFPIREQAERGEWNYNLKAVYCIGILDFTFNDYKEENEQNQVIHTVELKDQNNKVFYEKLKFIYLEMPNFKKQVNELTERIDKWLYFIKNLADLETIPSIFREEVFEQALNKAEIAKFTKSELANYEYSLKNFRDTKAVFEYHIQNTEKAYDEGIEAGKQVGMVIGKMEGIEAGKIEGKIEMAKMMLKNHEPIKKILKYTGLLESEINNLK